LPRQKFILTTGFMIWLLIWACTPARAAGPYGEAWSIAFVVEHSTAMTRPWMESQRRSAVEKALNLELRTLPLRISAGAWLAGLDRVKPLVYPSTSLELKEIDLKLSLPATSRADIAPAMEKAAKWLQARGGGSLIVIAANGPQAGSPLPSILKAENIFVHVLALEPKAQAKALAQLALVGGGSYFMAKEPGRVLTFLHRAVLTSLTPARLVIKAHDQTNRPLKLTYGLNRRDALSTDRKGLTGRVQQCLPGIYNLVWPKSAPTGPAPPPPKIRVAPTGLSEVSVGGQAKLKVAAQDKDGGELGWKMRVARLSDGLVLESSLRTPFELNLFAGSYLIKSLEKPLAWAVELEAGRDQNILVGPMGSLNVKLKGPKGPLRARYVLQDLAARRPDGTGYTNQLLRLKSGRYRLDLEVPPGLSREVTVSPAAGTELDLPAAGGLIVSQGRSGHRIEVLDQTGRVVDTGLVNRVIPLLVGKYLVRLAQVKGRDKVVLIKGGELITIEAGELAETRPAPLMPR
jgi:hypothetical protein